ncbi:MAG: type II toxin-antitoxin system RelE/ParE family toxin [Pseudomonadales bacterium]|nr:type II toxin-antitoxin system RelE/ParE family toxin [Pseudomonadales bacterium]
MIKSFKHKGLEKFYLKGSKAGVQAKHTKKLRFQLAALDTAQQIDDLDLPGYRLHPLKGQRDGIWSITVSANWRLTFKFADGNVHVLDYEDYH